MLCHSVWGDGQPCHAPALRSGFCVSHDPTRERLVARRPEDVREPTDLSRNDSRHIWEKFIVGAPPVLRPERHRRRARKMGRRSAA
jgi:hypothetical protein